MEKLNLFSLESKLYPKREHKLPHYVTKEEVLPKRLVETLRNYYQVQETKPKTYLFKKHFLRNLNRPDLKVRKQEARPIRKTKNRLTFYPNKNSSRQQVSLNRE